MHSPCFRARYESKRADSRAVDGPHVYSSRTTGYLADPERRRRYWKLWRPPWSRHLTSRSTFLIGHIHDNSILNDTPPEHLFIYVCIKVHGGYAIVDYKLRIVERSVHFVYIFV